MANHECGGNHSRIRTPSCRTSSWPVCSLNSADICLPPSCAVTDRELFRDMVPLQGHQPQAGGSSAAVATAWQIHRAADQGSLTNTAHRRQCACNRHGALAAAWLLVIAVIAAS